MSWDEASYTINSILKKYKQSSGSGIPPRDMNEDDFSVLEDQSYVKIRCIPPKNTVINGTTFSVVAGVRIVRKEGTPPLNPWDGVLVKEILVGSEETEFLDSDVDVGKTYYYHFYPYSDHGVYNLRSVNLKMITLA